MKKQASKNEVLKFAKKAKDASFKLSLLNENEKNYALEAIAKALTDEKAYIVKENEKDVKEARRQKHASALIDRLILNDKRIQGMIDCVQDTKALRDPIGEVLEAFTRPNGLVIKKVRVPFGVIGIIYESRPNVTSDCIALCLKSGNAVILKGGKEALYSNQAIYKVITKALKGTKIPSEAVQLIPSTDRKAVTELLALEEYVDLIVPRGGESLIRFVAENSRIPVVKHYKGNCHVYVSNHADLKMAEEICLNAKLQRPGVCNAMESLVVHKSIAAKFLPIVAEKLIAGGVELRGDEDVLRIVKKGVKKATAKDWSEEYLDLILSVKVVNNTDEAITHINKFGSRHSDAIVTKDESEAQKFLRGVDSACLYVNASTRFTDGYEFGFGAEVGISTDKLHVRGPMALEGLTTYKYEILGTGQVRP